MAKKSKKSSNLFVAILCLISLVFAFLTFAFVTMDGVGVSVTIGSTTTEGLFVAVKDIIFGVRDNNGEVIAQPNAGLLVGLIMVLLGALLNIATLKCKYAGYLGGLITLVGAILFFCATALYSDFQGGSIGGLGANKLLGSGFILMGICGILSAITSFVAGSLKK